MFSWCVNQSCHLWMSLNESCENKLQITVLNSLERYKASGLFLNFPLVLYLIQKKEFVSNKIFEKLRCNIQ